MNSKKRDISRIIKTSTVVLAVGAMAAVFVSKNSASLKNAAVTNVLSTITEYSQSVPEKSDIPESTDILPPEAIKIDINTAASEQLQTLPGIGEAKAAAIIAYREEHGAFSSVDELTNVSGIGEKTLEAFRDKVTASGQGSAASSSEPTDPSPETAKIDINTATSEQLQTLPGIGEAKAAAIIAYREEHGAFSSVDELTNISGIGAKTLEKFREIITV